MPLKPNLVFHDAPTVNETVHTAFNVELSPTKPDKDLSHRPSAPIIEDWVSNSEDEFEAEPLQNDPSFIPPTEQVKTPRPSVQTVEHTIPANHLRKDFPKNHAQRENHQHYAKMTHPNPQRHVVPTTVLTRSKLVLLTTARLVTAAVPHNNVIRPRPTKPVGTKPHSPPRRTINRKPSPPASNFPPKVTTAKAPKVNAVKRVQGNWVWKPKCPILDHVSCHISVSMTLKKFDYTDALGRSKSGNMSYLTDFEEINGGYVAFGGNPKGGKITCNGKIKTCKLDFDDVYFVKELKFNLFSISQICDKKNSLLFIDTGCVVLSLEFNNAILLRGSSDKGLKNGTGLILSGQEKHTSEPTIVISDN
nr:hypothetical protein [Tanacetum cinerariifolium]